VSFQTRMKDHETGAVDLGSGDEDREELCVGSD